MKNEIILTADQLFAIYRETEGKVIIEQLKPGKYTHTYVTDKGLLQEGRLLHVSKKGNVTVCERTV